MPGFQITAAKGWVRRLSRRASAGGLTLARNARYLTSDNRLWALLGRTRFNSTVIPASTLQTTDEGTVKALFAIFFDGAAGKLVVHKGGTLWEASLTDIGTFTKAFVMANNSTDVVPRGIPAAYRGQNDLTNWHYPVGRTGFKAQRRLAVRTSTAWRWGGHRRAAAPFTVAAQGTATFNSTTDVKYGYRIYDSNTDTESRLSATVTVPAWSDNRAANRLTWAAGVFLEDAELGTHIRIYRTLLNEPAGIYYRTDGVGNGIPIGDFVPTHFIDDSTTNINAQLQGTVRADGTEGTVAWAEHGGEPPPAGGCIVFDEHMVFFDLQDRMSDIIYSAQGFPESCPVDIDGNYAYFLRMESDQDDRVVTCTKAGQYLLIFGENSIFRVSKLPTLEDPGFTRRLQELVTSDHGVAGRYAAASFGIGPDQAQRTIYVCIEHGIMITDGINASQILPWIDFQSLVEPTLIQNVQVVDYSSKQEVWIAYTPVGGTTNTQAIIVDYSSSQRGLRITGPIDVKMDMAVQALCLDSKIRFYLADDTEKRVYVQDFGEIDTQENTNAAGDIQLDWELGRSMPNQRQAIHTHRCFIYGTSGVARTFTVVHKSLEGVVEDSLTDSTVLGPGEISDEVLLGAFGQGLRTRLSYLGPTGSDYTPDSANNPPALESIEYDFTREEGVTRTRDETVPI